MESSGFARALFTETDLPPPDVPRHDVLWTVVRGISDFGDKSSKFARIMASAAAAVVLREFLESGLRQCHPNELRPPTEAASQLPPPHFYAKRDGTVFFRERILSDLGVELEPDQPKRYRTVRSLAAALTSEAELSESQLVDYLNALRVDYFDDKYLNYGYEHDSRSLLRGWEIDFREIVRGELNMRLAGLTVLDVGCGNGLELEPLFHDAGHVIGVDVSSTMLDAARELFPSMTAVATPAEASTASQRTASTFMSLCGHTCRGCSTAVAVWKQQFVSCVPTAGLSFPSRMATSSVIALKSDD